MDWNGWPAERLVFLFLAIAYLVLWAQLTLYHWRGGFHNKAMWGPVIFTPAAIAAAGLYAAARTPLTEKLFIWVFALAVLEGLIGFVLHLRGVAAHVGGFSLRNLSSGPPALLAFSYAALAGFGLLVHFMSRNGMAA